MKVSILIFLFLSFSAWSETYDLTHRFGLGGGGGASIPIGAREFSEDANEDYMYNFHARYHTHDSDSLQLSYTYLDFEKTDISIKVYDLMYLYRINEVDRFTPVLGIGAGVADLSDFDPFDNLKSALKARFGFEYALTPDLFASLLVDYHFISKMPDDDDGMPLGEFHVLAPQLNLTFYFGHDKEESDSKKTEPKVALAVSVVDTDQDGISDDKDKCPGTPLEKKVNAYGCMAQEKASMQVEVFFPSGGSELSLNSHDSLEKLAAFLNEHPQTRVEIQGHTDNTGSDAKNRSLSAARANAVKIYLVEKLSISQGRVSSYGFGEEQPVGDNSTNEGRAKNRRVMAIISE